MPLSRRDVTLGDLYVAYRKAKVEAYYESTQVQALEFTAYEQQLQKNLARLQQVLLDPGASWCTDLAFLGTYAYLPKSIDVKAWDGDETAHFRALDPIVDWQSRFEATGRKANAKLRLIIRPSVDFQIISALWIIKAGHSFDEALNPRLCFGNRLRRTFNKESQPGHSKFDINIGAAGLFSPYFSAYRNWREQGLSAMESALVRRKDILAITMDLEQFYHRVSPRFLLRRRFLAAVNLHLSGPERTFTLQLLDAIDTWYRSTPDYSDRPQGGIPVGLSASKIIANVLLAEFDTAISEKLRPLYYGRYVDDIFLVFDNDSNLATADEVTKWLSTRLRPLLSLQRDAEGPPSLRLKLPYADDSDLIFAGAKQKIFALSSAHGLDLIQHIREQIRAQSSEYRLLPAVPDTGAEMASRALLATPDATLNVDALRKADKVSVKRLGLSLLLRDVETYASDLTPRSWTKVRREFYSLINRHVLTPKGFFDFVGYLPRVFGLMLGCGDFEEAAEFVGNFVRVRELLERTSNVGRGKLREKFDLCCKHYAETLLEKALQAATGRLVTPDLRFLEVLRKLRRIDQSVPVPRTVSQLTSVVNQILLADWGSRPYKDYWYLSQTQDEAGPPVPKPTEIRRKLRLGAIRRFRKLAGQLKVPHWPALAFPTRALRTDEICLAAPEVLADPERYRKAIMALRGAQVVSVSHVGIEPPPPLGNFIVFSVPGKRRKIIRVAISSLKTSKDQLNAAIRGRHDRSQFRYENFNWLINRILQENIRPDYIVFPELSIPLRWALRIARKLATNGVSFLAGVEYRVDRKTRSLRNDCLVSLVTHWPGYASHIVRLQPKFAPAHQEKLQLRTAVPGKRKVLYHPTGLLAMPTLYVHRGYCFSVLLCSDVTNIEHRNALRGELDSLFVLEWNQDTKTFSSLVEATALDLHTFVIQVNNREYGDSRIRVAAQKDFERDVVQVKGGITDFYVFGEIDYHAMREEQRGKITRKNARYKPAPIGFKMSERRRKDRR